MVTILLKSFKTYFINLFKNSMTDNLNKCLNLLEENPNGVLLDCGCSDGKLTIKVAKKVMTNNIYGIDLDEEVLKKARKKGIKTFCVDLNNSLPFENDFFDVIFAHQLLAHLYDVDNFVKEIYRIIKPGGYAVVSTENLSSWHNIFALILGYQDFSHHISREFYIGNPLSPHYKEKIEESLRVCHYKVLTSYSLKELFEIHGFKLQKIVGAGYYPFTKKLSSFLSSLDSRHAHFLTIKIKKEV